MPLKSTLFRKIITPNLTNLLTTTISTTTKPFVMSIWDRLHEPKENYAGSGTWINFLHSFLSGNTPSLRHVASISCRITSIHVFFGLPCTLLTCLIWYTLLAGHTCKSGMSRKWSKKNIYRDLKRVIWSLPFLFSIFGGFRFQTNSSIMN